MADRDTVFLQVQISKELNSKLEAMARDSERSKTKFVRWLIAREWERQEHAIPSIVFPVIEEGAEATSLPEN